MKNLATLQPDVIRLMNKHYTKGRGGRKIRYVVIHHTAGILTTEQVWQVWQTRAASANYIVEVSGRIGQLVFDNDTSWANADLRANQESITIEHSNNGGANQDWPISDATIEAGAEWVAAICVFYKLGRPEWGKNVRGHSEFHSTSCPYHLRKGGKYHDRYMSRAQFHYDRLTSPAPKPAAPAPAASSSSSSSPFGDAMTLIRSLINSAKSFTANGMLALIDRATWETRVVVNELAKRQGIDPDALVAEAIRKDNEK